MGEQHWYTAWDGKEYVGPPPDGWFLAADNRWWPSVDEINKSGAQPPPDPTPPQPTPTASHQAHYPSPPSEIPPPEIPPSDIPPPGIPTTSNSTGGAGFGGNRTTRRTRPSRSSRLSRTLLLLAGVALASRCADLLEPSAELQRERLDVLVEAESGFGATTESCVGGVILGEISNWSGAPQTYAVASTVPDGVERLSPFIHSNTWRALSGGSTLRFLGSNPVSSVRSTFWSELQRTSQSTRRRPFLGHNHLTF